MQHSIFFILCLAVLWYSCSSTKQTIPEHGTITGRIFVIGNEPFTKIAIQISEGKMYSLGYDKTIEKELQAHQGQLVSVQYNGTELSPEGQLLKVTKVEFPSTK